MSNKGPLLVQLAFMTTTSDSFRQIQLWTQYHRALGVELFYLFVDGQVGYWGQTLGVTLSHIPMGSGIAVMCPALDPGSTHLLTAR
jgi:hypothetical protein